MSYGLVLSRTALKALRDLSPPTSTRVSAAIDALKEEPRPSGCKKLQGKEELWRIRVGEYRVIYSIDDTVRIIDVRRIGHLGDIYR
ncbi:MAG: type II toxin-antitoxin system RelE/ParE family toxin [Flavobacteriales bacterium]|nr:type II toxin-antitoxin system RelE/ParE family toxin [Flavobacteriales bacterium]